jgi:uncharacterized protein (TIGR02147 family)
MTSGPSPLNVYRYLDYQEFLGDFYRHKKSINRGFSYRLFCRKAGINSPGYVSEVIGGSRSLSKAYVPKFARAMELDEKETAYLELLVSFKHAKSAKAKQAIYALMVAALPLKIQRLRQSQLEYFSKWYHVAVRETLSIEKVRDDYESLARRLSPAITAVQAKSAIRILGDLELIEKDAQGFWKARHASLVTKGDPAQSILFTVYRKAMMAKAVEALDLFPAHQQNSSCVTLSVSQSGMDRIMAHLEDFHQRVLETVQSDRDEDRVLQVNMQIFPLTRIGSPDASA